MNHNDYRYQASKIILLILGIIPFMVSGQSQINGKVFASDTGEELPGATVSIKGSTSGTITDIYGKFSVSAKAGDVLEISFVGFISKTITVTASNSLVIQLAPDIEALEEVVVVGYGTQRKSDITGSV
ncbi:MAG: carboxypeptidase-like regulatory domain-containing protein, partial [Ekhidna sp.]|nr:carboxypeptidase-like regulatory domain-containing protein [Ekhidna sp.]